MVLLIPVFASIGIMLTKYDRVPRMPMNEAPTSISNEEKTQNMKHILSLFVAMAVTVCKNLLSSFFIFPFTFSANLDLFYCSFAFGIFSGRDTFLMVLIDPKREWQKRFQEILHIRTPITTVDVNAESC